MTKVLIETLLLCRDVFVLQQQLKCVPRFFFLTICVLRYVYIRLDITKLIKLRKLLEDFSAIVEQCIICNSKRFPKIVICEDFLNVFMTKKPTKQRIKKLGKWQKFLHGHFEKEFVLLNGVHFGSCTWPHRSSLLCYLGNRSRALICSSSWRLSQDTTSYWHPGHQSIWWPQTDRKCITNKFIYFGQ